MLTREEQITKVQKVLALTKSNHEGEVEAALLMAQKLLAKYHLSMAEIAGNNPEAAREEAVVRLNVVEVSAARPWVRILGGVVAKNFRCVTYICSGRGKHWLVFVSYETDVNVCGDVYRAAFKYCERVSNNRAQLANDRGMSCEGIKTSFCNGFVRGLEKAYRDQVANDPGCALMVIVPEKAKKVLEGMGTFAAGVKQDYYRDEHFHAGQTEGYAYGSRTQIEEG